MGTRMTLACILCTGWNTEAQGLSYPALASARPAILKQPATCPVASVASARACTRVVSAAVSRLLFTMPSPCLLDTCAMLFIAFQEHAEEHRASISHWRDPTLPIDFQSLFILALRPRPLYRPLPRAVEMLRQRQIVWSEKCSENSFLYLQCH